MYNSEIKKPELPFTVSSIFFIIITMVKLFNNYLLPLSFDESIYASAESTIYMIVTLMLAIFLIIKKLFVVNTILIGILAAFETYWLISYLSQGYLDSAYTFAYILSTIAWILLFVVSIGAATKDSFKGIGKVWFVPILLHFTALPIYIYDNFKYMFYWIDDIDYYDDALLWVVRSIFWIILDILFAIAFTLLCKWYGRVIRDQREALESATYYEQPVYAQPTYEQPVYAEPVYEQPTQPIYAQPTQPVYTEPAQPVAPVYAQPAYQAPVQTDLAAELEKYKSLYEQGLITQAEYDAKRAQLLNL